MNELTYTEKMDSLAFDIIDFLLEEEMFTMVNIYVNQKCLSSDPGQHDETIHRNEGIVYVTNECDVTQILKYSNPDTITMTYEGPLNFTLNQGSARIEHKLSALFRKYGLYFEFGHAWSLAGYKI